METNKSEPDLYLKELREINWFNTSEAKVKEAYNGWASTYDKWATGREPGSSPVPPGYVGHIRCADTFNAAATEAFGDSKTNLKLLDLGCGTGLLGQTLKETFGFGNLVGLDASENMLEKAKEKGVYNKLICSFVSNAGVPDIENAEFEGVLASGVIGAGLIKPDVFDEILRWIKPDARNNKATLFNDDELIRLEKLFNDFSGGIICFNCRSDSYENEEYGYRKKFESLEMQKRWKLISNTDSDYYGGESPTARLSSTRARMLVYRMLPF